MPDGRILVADGLDNHRVIIYDNDMNYLGEFGGEGDGPGQFNTLHAVAVGPEGRVFVLDRMGNEVNLFRATDDPAVFEFEPLYWLAVDSAPGHHRQRKRFLDY